MNTILQSMNWAVLAVLLSSTSALAGDERFDVDFNAALGATYDSNVALVDLDSSAGEADTASVLEAGLGLKARLTDNLWLQAGYGYSGTRYRQFTEFDLDLHHARAAVTLRRGVTDAGITLDRFAGMLSGEDYLVQTQVAASVSRLFGTRWFARGAYTRGDKSYAAFEERDTTTDALRVDAYLLFSGMDHYVSGTLQQSAENALDAGYDFDSFMGQLGWGYRVDLPRTEIELKAQLRWEQRDYAGVILRSGKSRSDERRRARLSAAIPFSEHVSVGVSIEHTSNSSSQDEANLDRTVYAMEFGVAF